MAANKDTATLSFEKAFERLETILEKMNSGKVSLEDSLALYEEANQLIMHCNARLTNAERKIETLIKNRQGELQLGKNGPETQDFMT